MKKSYFDNLERRQVEIKQALASQPRRKSVRVNKTMDLALLKEAVPGLSGKTHYDKILIFGWWLHAYKNKSFFTGSDVKKCLRRAPLRSSPTAFSPYIKGLVERKLLRATSGYKLENRDPREIKFGIRQVRGYDQGQ